MDGFDWNLVQWPAMAVTVTGAWLTGSHLEFRRRLGFWFFLLSNVLWAAWAFHVSAWALIVLQVFLVITNIRGARNNDDDQESPA